MSASIGPKLSFSSFKKDSTIDYSSLQKKLSAFQIDKLTFFFRAFFDADGNGVVDANDFKILNERLRKIAGWEPEDQQYHAMVDNNSVFLECLLDQVKTEQDLHKEGLEDRTWEEALRPSKIVIESVTLNQWLNMWAKLCDMSAGISDFPIWVQLIPQVMFAVQCGKNKKGYITKECLMHFYENFAGVKERNYGKVTFIKTYYLNLQIYSLNSNLTCMLSTKILKKPVKGKTISIRNIKVKLIGLLLFTVLTIILTNQSDSLGSLVDAGYDTMTANGDYDLNLDNYCLLFANFLLGKTIYGPGKFIFGCFDNSDLSQKYQIIFEE